MIKLALAVIVAVYATLGIGGVWLATSARLRERVELTLDAWLERRGLRRNTKVPWGRSRFAFRWYGLGISAVGLVVAGGEVISWLALAGGICFLAAFFGSMTAGFLAVVRTKRLFVLSADRIWEVAGWAAIFALGLLPSAVVRVQ